MAFLNQVLNYSGTLRYIRRGAVATAVGMGLALGGSIYMLDSINSENSKVERFLESHLTELVPVYEECRQKHLAISETSRQNSAELDDKLGEERKEIEVFCADKMRYIAKIIIDEDELLRR